MLVALPESQELFHRFSRNPSLLPVGIAMNPDVLSIDQLREQAWQKIEPLYLTRLEELKRRFHEARARQAGSADLSDVAKAAVAGQIGTLLVEADRFIPGVLDRISGSICTDDVVDLHVDDMLDDLAELVMSKDGEVVVVPTERMPTETGVAAINRF